jgi:hypothetical protein
MMLYLLILTHFVADFLLQTRRMGKEKSENEKVLFMHGAIIFTCFLPFGWKLSLANVLIHMVIDWNIWRIYKRYAMWNKDPTLLVCGEYRYWEDKWFYTFIGIDQTLHVLTLIFLNNVLN